MTADPDISPDGRIDALASAVLDLTGDARALLRAARATPPSASERHRARVARDMAAKLARVLDELAEASPEDGAPPRRLSAT